MADKVKQLLDSQKKAKTFAADLRKLGDSVKSAKKDGASAKGGGCEDQLADVQAAAAKMGIAAGLVVASVAFSPATAGATLLGFCGAVGATMAEAIELGQALRKWQDCLKGHNDPRQKDAANWLKQVEDLRAKLARENDALKKLK